MIINVSNHPMRNWDPSQIETARELGGGGEIVDIPHPNVPPEASNGGVWDLAWEVFWKIAELKKQCAPGEPCFVHLMGEAGFVHCLNKILERKDIRAIYSTTSREVVEGPDGSKISRFRFVRFRDYLGY